MALMSMRVPYCVLFACRHLQSVEVGPAAGVDDVPVRLTCPAYPDGVPEAIMYGNGHAELRGDEAEDVKFEEADDPGAVQLRFDAAAGFPLPEKT